MDPNVKKVCLTYGLAFAIWLVWGAIGWLHEQRFTLPTWLDKTLASLAPRN